MHKCFQCDSADRLFLKPPRKVLPAVHFGCSQRLARQCRISKSMVKVIKVTSVERQAKVTIDIFFTISR